MRPTEEYSKGFRHHHHHHHHHLVLKKKLLSDLILQYNGASCFFKLIKALLLSVEEYCCVIGKNCTNKNSETS